MATSFKTEVKRLNAAIEQRSNFDLIDRLASIRKASLDHAPSIRALADQLLFLLAYPSSDTVFQSALHTAKKVAATCKALRMSGNQLEEGLPFASVISTFTPDFLEWMLQEKHLRVSKSEALGDYNEILKVSLPELWSVETQLGWNNEELLEVLGVKPAQEISFLLEQLRRISALGRVRESFMDALQLYVNVSGTDERFQTSSIGCRLHKHSAMPLF